MTLARSLATVGDARMPEVVRGVVVAPVVDNKDFNRTGTVNVRMPWGNQPIFQAPVIGVGAARDRGIFWMPKADDNVVLAFADGDPTQPYVVGGLWVGTDLGPIADPDAADFQQVIRTSAGQEIRIDEREDSVTIKTSSGQTIESTPKKVEVTSSSDGGSSKLTLGADGKIVLEASVSIELSAPKVSVNAGNALELKSGATANVEADSSMTIKAGTVGINP